MIQEILQNFILLSIVIGIVAIFLASSSDWKKYNLTTPKVAKQSESINEFLAHVKKNSRFVAPKEGFIWQTTDSKLKDIVYKNFSTICNQTGLLDKQRERAPINTTIIIKNSKISQCTKLESLQSYSSVSAGGFPALWSAYIQSLLYKKGFLSSEDKLPPVYILPANMKNSAYFGSSTQYHVSHAAPMYTDPEFGTFNIIMASMKRTLFPSQNNPEKDNYMIAEISPKEILNKNVLSVGIGYLFNEIKYKFQSKLGLNSIADETIRLAISSGLIMDDISKELGEDILIRDNTVRVAYNQSETDEMVKLKKQLAKYDIKCKEIPLDKVKKLTGTKPNISEKGSVWSIEGDGYLNPNIINILIEAIKKNGGKILEGFVSEIYYNEDKQKVEELKVVQNAGTENESSQIIKSNSVFTSFGARANYQFDKKIKKSKNPEFIISGTGYSAYLIVEGNIKKPIDSNNTHFTPLSVAQDSYGNDITLVKSTCGANIGSNSFCIDHAVNSLHYATKIIFVDKKVDIICAKSCSRPLNGLNSAKINEIIIGLNVATGFGGKGVTDSAGFAVKHATKIAGTVYEKEIINNFLRKYDA